MSELHPVTKLLLARMESHPEEFADLYNPRWSAILGEFENEAMEEDHKVFRTALSRIRMDKLHEKVMDELLNGEERRAEELKRNKDAEYYAQVLRAQNMTAQAQQLGLSNNQPTWTSSALANAAAADAAGAAGAASTLGNLFGKLGRLGK